MPPLEGLPFDKDMEQLDIIIDNLSREYAKTVTRPLCDTDILDAFKAGAFALMNYINESANE